MNKLALFDIDWTLMKPSKAHRNSFNEAFKQVYGVQAEHEKLNIHGWTDRKIIFETLKLAGLDDASIEAKINEAIHFMSRYFAKAIEDHPLEVMPGTEELLKELFKHNVRLGVLTGNIEPIAKEKLRMTGLDKYFSTGYFGNMSQDRADLAHKAVEDAKRDGIAKDGVFVIGDTPLDISAGKRAGTKTIGVATGKTDVNELGKAGADLVVRDFYEIEPIKKLILG